MANQPKENPKRPVAVYRNGDIYVKLDMLPGTDPSKTALLAQLGRASSAESGLPDNVFSISELATLRHLLGVALDEIVKAQTLIPAQAEKTDA